MITQFCIKHEHSTLVQNSPTGDIHEVLFFNEFGQLDIDWCEYELGWATCPPEIDPDWELHLVEPSQEEIDEMENI
jgi:xylose isomerase